MSTSVTIREVAAKAGASLSTVSHALNDRAGLVSESTRKRIVQIAEEMGYRPSRRARQLRRQSNMTISVQLDSSVVSNNVGRSSFALMMLLLRGLSVYAASKGYHVHLLTAPPGQDMDELEQQIVRENAIDGVVFLGYSDRAAIRGRLPGLLKQLAACNIPTVTVDREVAAMGVPAVAVDLEPAVVEAVARVKAQGHRRVAYIGKLTQGVHEAQSRFSMFEASLAEAGIELPEQWVVPASLEIDGYLHTESLLRQSDRPDCIIYSADHLAMAGYRAIERQGLAVPGDISLLAVDHAPYASELPFTLASLDQRLYERGQMLAKLILRQIESSSRIPDPITEIAATFVDGESLGPFAAGCE